MKYMSLVAAIITSLIIFSKNLSRRKRNKKLLKLRSKWGLLQSEYYNFDKIGIYAALKQEGQFHLLTEQTKNDIDFYDLFSFANRTVSKPGQQYLFDILSKPTNNTTTLQELDQQVDFFTTNQNTREECQLLLSELNDDNAYHIASLLSGQLPEKPKWFGLVIADIFITVLLVVLSFYFHVLLLWLMLPLAVNLALHYWNRNNIFYFVKSLPQLNVLSDICKKLSNQNLPFNKEDAKKGTEDLKKFQRRILLLGLQKPGIGGDPDVIRYFLLDMIKAFFLVELLAFFSLVNEIKNKQGAIHDLFKYAGSIDTAISIASMRAGDAITCKPDFIPSAKESHAVKIYHPLIENCVTNDITVSNKSILITGSNMSGKTTFLRTIAINSLLAQTIYTCFAESFQTPFVKLFSSIRIDDSVLEGKSYYFEEVNIMGGLVNEVKSDHQDLFILDEVFKGTNTIERIASAKAILSYLNKQDNIVFVSTHDIELSDLLKAEYDLYHFEETIIGNELKFDHTLKPGQLTTRNAIKILEISGYPKEIIDEANALSKTLSL